MDRNKTNQAEAGEKKKIAQAIAATKTWEWASFDYLNRYGEVSETETLRSRRSICANIRQLIEDGGEVIIGSNNTIHVPCEH